MGCLHQGSSSASIQQPAHGHAPNYVTAARNPPRANQESPRSSEEGGRKGLSQSNAIVRWRQSVYSPDSRKCCEIRLSHHHADKLDQCRSTMLYLPADFNRGSKNLWIPHSYTFIADKLHLNIPYMETSPENRDSNDMKVAGRHTWIT